MSTQEENRIKSRYAGINLEGYPHPMSTWFVVFLRLAMGGMILFAGLGKYAFVPGGEAFDAWGYLAHREAVSPVSGVYAAMAESALIVDVINVLIPATQVLIGLALIFGVFVRLAALGGAIQMFAFYLGGWEGELLAVFDSTLIYAILFLALGAFAAGRIMGVDRYLEQWKVGDETLIERWPKLGYFLG